MGTKNKGFRQRFKGGDFGLGSLPTDATAFKLTNIVEYLLSTQSKHYPRTQITKKLYLGSENIISHKLDYQNRTEELLRPDSNNKGVREVTGDLGSNPCKTMLLQRYYIQSVNICEKKRKKMNVL